MKMPGGTSARRPNTAPIKPLEVAARAKSPGPSRRSSWAAIPSMSKRANGGAAGSAGSPSALATKGATMKGNSGYTPGSPSSSSWKPKPRARIQVRRLIGSEGSTGFGAPSMAKTQREGKGAFVEGFVKNVSPLPP